MTTKVGFLGAGYMSSLHMGNLKKLDDIEICAIYDANRESAEKLKANMDLSDLTVYDSYEEMLDKSNIDALYICIPPFAHNGQFEIAASKGINIFIEKPIALSTKTAEKMVKAAMDYGIITHVGYHMRFGGAVDKLKKMIEDGSAGKPTLFDARYECNALHTPWWKDVEKSGGQILEQIIHLYDMSMFLLGRPKNILGMKNNICHTETPGYTVEDTSASCIMFENGSMASIVASNCAVPRKWRYNFTVVCENVTVYFNNENDAEFIYTDKDTPESEIVKTDNNRYFDETKAFIDAVNNRNAKLASVQEGYDSLKLVESVVKSSNNGSCPIEY